ncbi:MAG TPA: hypothetical protein VI357_06925 [Mycobacteriales bacterium]
MTRQIRSTVPRRNDPAVPDTWTRVRLVEPSTAGFVLVAASSGPWPVPVALPRGRRRALVARMRAVAAALRRDPGVLRADVFTGVLRPPAARAGGPAPDFDAVLLVETASVARAEDLRAAPLLTGLVADLRAAAHRTFAFTGSNPRRIGPVDHDRQGVFLFNFFSARDVESTLFAWQYTAGWFQDQTGLDNSTVLQPADPEVLPYTVVNHCRWDRLRDVLPALLVKRSFRTFVLRVFDENGVVPHPVLYRLSR